MKKQQKPIHNTVYPQNNIYQCPKLIDNMDNIQWRIRPKGIFFLPL